MDFLEAHKEHVEREVFFHMADLMNADVDVIFYDTTSLHFEVDEEDSAPERGNKLAGGHEYPALRQRGHSKNGRGDVPQLVVGLAVTRDGLPVRSWVFPGNTVDVTTVEKVKQDLRGWRLGRCVFVGDAGMNSEENRRTLALGGGKFILAARMRAGDDASQGCSRQAPSPLSWARRLVTRRSARHVLDLPIITGEVHAAAMRRPSNAGFRSIRS